MTAAIIVACADGRLREYLLALETRLDIDGADRLLVPGGPLAFLRQHERTTMLGWLDMLVRVRGTELLCLVSHEDCLAYADRLADTGLTERRALERDLAQAGQVVASRFASLRIEGFIVPRDPALRPGRLSAPERIAL